MNLFPGEKWKTSYPGAHVGVLAMSGVANPSFHPGLEERKRELETGLRAVYAGLDRPALDAIPILQAYNAYYKPFKKTYHVQLQLESILFKAKSLPTVAALVEAMFMAEIKNLLLTAGHDMDVVLEPLLLDIAAGDESYVLLRGQQQLLKPGDMYIADASGVISSILYGPDQRTQISPHTQNVLFTVYAPPGIPAASVVTHLEDIRDLVRLVAPEAQTRGLEVVTAG